MDADRGIRIGCIDEAEDLSRCLVDPVAEIADAVAILGLEIGEVCLGNVGRLDTAVNLMAVHEERHRILLGSEDRGMGSTGTSGGSPHLGPQGVPNWCWRLRPG
jgi:hypothetical protein